MKIVLVVGGVACLFLISLNSVNFKQKTNQKYSAKVCFEQRAFDLIWEFENTETNLINSFKPFSKNDKKRTNDSTDRITGYLCKHSIYAFNVRSMNGLLINLFFLFNKSQSLFQVFLL